MDAAYKTLVRVGARCMSARILYTYALLTSSFSFVACTHRFVSDSDRFPAARKAGMMMLSYVLRILRRRTAFNERFVSPRGRMFTRVTIPTRDRKKGEETPPRENRRMDMSPRERDVARMYDSS